MAPFIPSGPGVRTSSAPNAASSLRRSTLIVSGMVRMRRYPRAAATKASAIAGIAARRLDDDRVLLQESSLLRGLDHGHADTVLDAAARIEVLQLCQNLRAEPRAELANRTSGVFPTSSVILRAIFAMRHPSSL